MYSLDVNFLKDRHLEHKPAAGSTAEGPPLKEQLPIYIGAGVALALPLLAGLSLLFVGWQKEQTQQNIQVLEGELAKLNAQNQKIQSIEGKIKVIDEEVAGLVGVFYQIKPWSAILQDLTDQTPSNVQISGIVQSELVDKDNTSGVEQKKQILTLTGFARNYGDLNDFLLTLQNSRFLKADNTKLVNATASALPITEAETEGSKIATSSMPTGKLGDRPAGPIVTMPMGVKYTIATELSETPDNELVNELTRKGAIGLVTRFNILKQKGIQPPPSLPPATSPILQPGTPNNPQVSPAPTPGAKTP